MLTWNYLSGNTGCPPKKMGTKKTGEDITSKLGQPHPLDFHQLKAHLVDIKCVYMKEIGHPLFEIQPAM